MRPATLADYLRTLAASRSDYRKQISAYLESLTMRHHGKGLFPKEELAIEGVITEIERKMQNRHILTHSDLLPLATWLNTVLR